ncbi:unannotated protein [freshwater metagenome]|uniref:Unannotated protein n=1 Tax=freshwater metagenome TaxID=449393 RepID=A0A6J7JNV6_9ZZZZ
MGHALEYRPHDLRAAAAAGEAEQCSPGSEIPTRGSEAEQRGHVHNPIGVGALRGHRVRVGHGIDDAEIVAEPFNIRSRRQHDGFDTPDQLLTATPGHDRKGTVTAATGERRAVRSDHHVEHPAGAERDLRRAWCNTALTDE